MALAWHTAALVRSKKLPALRKLLIRHRPAPQTWQEQLAIAKMWTAALGGTITSKEKH